MGWRLGTLAVLAVAAGLVAPALAEARVERYAVLIGHNTGEADEPTLHYAEADALKMHDVLRELGDVPPEHLVLLRGDGPAVVRRTLIQLNDRIRAREGGESMLLVFYSGHADADALHLGGETLDIAELEALVRGSPADFRVLIVDACRSGALTKVKGGAPAPPFPVMLEQRLAGKGAVFWTSSAVNEDAQESDALKGSFFTHYLVSGLRGAADSDGDGQVALDEAYRHAYAETLRASSRTLAGTQHPTYRYDVAGRGAVPLTFPSRADARRERASLAFPPGRSYLVFQGPGDDGAVVAEVTAWDRQRVLGMRPGTYFVRGRGRRDLVEGAIALGPGQRVDAEDRLLTRIEYAELVRKGRDIRRVSGPQAGLMARAARVPGGGPCLGAFAGYALALPWLDVGARVVGCTATTRNEIVDARLVDGLAELRFGRSLSVGRGVALQLGWALGAGVLHQSYDSRAMTADKTTFGGTSALGLGASWSFGHGLYALAELSVRAWLYRMRDSTDEQVHLVAPLAPELSVGVGAFF